MNKNHQSKWKIVLSVLLVVFMLPTLAILASANEAPDAATNNITVEEGVASVDGKGYATLAEAIAAAQDGQTITLLADVSLTTITKLENEVIIDLNGKTVSSTAKKTFEVHADVTIKNGTIKGASRCVDTRTAVELVLENVTLIADTYNSFGNPQPLTIGGSTNGTKVTMNNVTIQAGTTGYAIISFVKTELTANNSNIGGYIALYVKGGSEDSEFNFNNSTLTATTGNNDVSGNTTGAFLVECADVAINVTGGSVSATGEHCYVIYPKAEAENLEVQIEAEVSGNKVGGNKYAPVAEDGALTVVKAVATVDGKGYATFAEAIAAAQDGQTITLLADVSLTTITKLENEVIIDLNGKTVSSTAKKTFEVHADVTIKNGTIKGASRCVDTRTAVELVLENVTLIADTYNSFGNPQPLTIGGSTNGTKVTMNNVTIQAGTTGYAIISFVKTELTANNSNIGGYIALYVKGGSEDSEFNFNNSTLTATTGNNDVSGNTTGAFLVECADVAINVTGGSVSATGEHCYVIYPKAEAENLEVQIEAEVSGNKVGGNKYAPVAEDGALTVVKAVATVDGKGYATFAEAIAAAQDGQTVTLLADVSLTTITKLEKNVIIDLNGKTVSSTAKKTFEVHADVTIKNGTIKGASRCVDTRTAVELVLEDVTLIADTYNSFGNPQPLTIGGSTNGTKVTMNNVTIQAGTTGYAIISFVKTELTANNSNLGGYIALYVKGGSENSEFNFNNSTLAATTGNNDVAGNVTGAFLVECADVAINVTGGSVSATGEHCYVIYPKAEAENLEVQIEAEVSGNKVGGDKYVAVDKDGALTVEKKVNFDIEYTNVVIAQSFKISFAFALDLVADWTDYYVEITKISAHDGSEITIVIPYTEWTATSIGSDRYIVVDYAGVAAKELVDVLNVVVYDANGNAVSNTKTDSIKDYVMRKLVKSTDAALSTLLVDIVNYGAEAQTYFGYATDKLANAELTDAQKGLASDEREYSDEMYSTNAEFNVANTLSLEYNIQLKVGIDLRGVTVQDGAKIVVSYVDYEGHTITKEVSLSEYNYATEVVIVTCDTLTALDAKAQVSFELVNGEDKVLVFSNSVESFTARLSADNAKVDICTALMKYCDSAKAYFNK